MLRQVIFAAALVAGGMSVSACKGKKAAPPPEAQTAAPEKPAEQAKAPADPYWDAQDLVVIRNEKACPEGLWALFPGPAPGGDDAKRKENAARRDEVAKALRQKTFVARLRGPQEVSLKDYDAPKGQFPLEVKGVVDCEDSIGRIAFTFTDAKPITPPHSAATSDEITQSYWDGPNKTFSVPMKSMSEAKDFKMRHQFGLEAYVVFKIGKTDVHHKLVKVPKETQGDVTIGGTTDDFGAGRLVRATVEGWRVLANPGPVTVVDTKDPSKVSLK